MSACQYSWVRHSSWQSGLSQERFFFKNWWYFTIAHCVWDLTPFLPFVSVFWLPIRDVIILFRIPIEGSLDRHEQTQGSEDQPSVEETPNNMTLIEEEDDLDPASNGTQKSLKAVDDDTQSEIQELKKRVHSGLMLLHRLQFFWLRFKV